MKSRLCYGPQSCHFHFFWRVESIRLKLLTSPNDSGMITPPRRDEFPIIVEVRDHHSCQSGLKMPSNLRETCQYVLFIIRIRVNQKNERNVGNALSIDIDNPRITQRSHSLPHDSSSLQAGYRLA